DQLAELFHREGKTGETPPPRREDDATPAQGRAEAKAAFTDLRLPLVHALERSGAGHGKVLGIVLLTDGQHNAGQPPTSKAQELGERQLPIYPIALGARRPPPDVALVSIQAPNAVFKDVETSVEVSFKVAGLPAQDFLVELHRTGNDGKKALAERIVHHDGND